MKRERSLSEKADQLSGKSPSHAHHHHTSHTSYTRWPHGYTPGSDALIHARGTAWCEAGSSARQASLLTPSSYPASFIEGDLCAEASIWPAPDVTGRQAH